MDISRRGALAAGAAAAAWTSPSQATTVGTPSVFGPVLDPVRARLVLDLLVVTAAPVRTSSSGDDRAPDGRRGWVWPIVGGRFQGRGGLRGSVIPGGCDAPVRRLDDTLWLDALYRLRTEDGYQIIVRNRGLYCAERTRTVPSFIVNKGPHDWLNKSMFVATLVEQVPPEWRTATAGQQDRLLQVYELV